MSSSRPDLLHYRPQIGAITITSTAGTISDPVPTAERADGNYEDHEEAMNTKD